MRFLDTRMQVQILKLPNILIALPKAVEGHGSTRQNGRKKKSGTGRIRRRRRRCKKGRTGTELTIGAQTQLGLNNGGRMTAVRGPQNEAETMDHNPNGLRAGQDGREPHSLDRFKAAFRTQGLSFPQVKGTA